MRWKSFLFSQPLVVFLCTGQRVEEQGEKTKVLEKERKDGKERGQEVRAREQTHG